MKETQRGVQAQIPPHVENTTGHLKGLPSTSAALQLVMTGFLTAAKGEDQSDWERGRRRHGQQSYRK